MIDYGFLQEQNVSAGLIADVKTFAEKHAVLDSDKGRLCQPVIPYFGREILEMAISALLQGENLLLSGSKATGKNVLAENLAYIFGRPIYNVSFHVNTDSFALIGADTFKDNEVTLRSGPVSLCALGGGFGILDEINMAKNEAVSVLHATLDQRRIIDIPGYDKIELHPACRFIGTMNYGYAGTRDLNEALVSRFLVIDMPPIDEVTLRKIISYSVPDISPMAAEQFGGLFMDLQKKAENGEISTKPVDLRGMLAAIRTMRHGVSPVLAIKMGITNKSFDNFEKELVSDIVATRIPDAWTKNDIFEG